VSETIELNTNLTLIAPVSRVIGGKETTRKVKADNVRGVARDVKAEVDTHWDNKPERERAERIVNNATAVLRKRATNTPFGWLAPRDRIPEINRRLDGLRYDAEVFNSESESCKVQIGIVTLDVSHAIADPATARAIADHVIGELKELRASLRDGYASRAQSILNFRVGAIADLTVGIVREAIICAIDEAKSQLSTLKAKIKGDGSVSETPESAGRALDLTMLDSALGMLGASVQDKDSAQSDDEDPTLALASG
jgi:hypothetical protein